MVGTFASRFQRTADPRHVRSTESTLLIVFEMVSETA